MTIVRKSIALICAWAALAAPPHALAVPAATAPVFPAPYVQSTLTSGNAVTANVTNPVTSGLVAEYPMTEGSGTVVHDISGNGNTASFASGSNAPAWGTYGIQFSNPGSWGQTATWLQTPVKTWLTALIYTCVGLPIGTTGTSIGGLPVSNFPSLLGTPANTDGVTVLNSWSNNLSNAYTGALIPGLFTPTNTSFPTYTKSPIPSPCGVVAATLSSSDHLFFNGQELNYGAQGASFSKVTTSTIGYEIGDHNNSSQEVFKGTIAYVTFYSGILTQAQIQMVTQYMRYQVESRPGFPLPVARVHNQAAIAVMIGDSLTASYNGNAQWPSSTYISTNNSYTFSNQGVGGQFAATNVSISALREGTVLTDASGRNVCHIWEGTNDVANGWGRANTALNIQVHAKEARAEGCDRVIIATMISRTGQDANKDALNAWLRQQWHGFADALDDLAAIPNIGADGAYANTTSPACFNADNIHLTGPSGTGSCIGTLTGYAFVGKQVGRLINMLDGATIDDPTVTSSNAYVETDADNYLLQTPTAAATNTLPDCLGFTGIKRRITNGSGSYAVTVSGSGNTTAINGSNIVLSNASAEFTCMLTSATSGGNYWLRTQ